MDFVRGWYTTFFEKDFCKHSFSPFIYSRFGKIGEIILLIQCNQTISCVGLKTECSAWWVLSSTTDHVQRTSTWYPAPERILLAPVISSRRTSLYYYIITCNDELWMLDQSMSSTVWALSAKIEENGWHAQTSIPWRSNRSPMSQG